MASSTIPPAAMAATLRWLAVVLRTRRVPAREQLFGLDTTTALADLPVARARERFATAGRDALITQCLEALKLAEVGPRGPASPPPDEPEALWQWAVARGVSGLLLLPASSLGGISYSSVLEVVCPSSPPRDRTVVERLRAEASIPFPSVVRERPPIAPEFTALASTIAPPLELPGSHLPLAVEIRINGTRVYVQSQVGYLRMLAELTPSGVVVLDGPREPNLTSQIRLSEFLHGTLDLLAWPTPAERRALEMAITPRWRQLVAALGAVVVEEAAPSRPTRVAFHIDLDGKEIEIKLQKEKKAKKGEPPGWTIGKTITRMSDLTDVDDETRRLVEQILDPYGLPNLTRPALLALIGHPHVFVDGAAVRVIEEEPRLRARSVEGGAVAVDVVVHEQAVSPDVLTEPRSSPPIVRVGDLLVVVTVPHRLRSVLVALGETRGVVPPPGREAVLQAMASVGARLTIDVDPALLGETRPADPRPIVRIEPSTADVAIAIVVRPLPGAAAFAPGHGSENVVGVDGMTRVFCTRDFDRERHEAGAFALEHLPDVAFDAAYRATMTMQDALAVVQHLQQRADIVVEWPARRLSVNTAPPSSMRLEVAGSATGLHVRGSIDVDGATLDLVRVIEASREGQRFIALDERRFVALTDELRARAAALGDAGMVGEVAVQGGAGIAIALEELAALGVEVQGQQVWTAWRQRLQQAASVDDEPPPGLEAVLRPYQREGLRFFRRLTALGTGGVLADDMGLGKTLQAIALLVERAAMGPQLIVAPTSVAFNWRRELERFAPGLRVHALDVEDRAAVVAALTAGDVLIVSYGLLVREQDELAKVRFSTLMLDEAQAVKNAEAQRARAVRAVVADVRFALTGTPLENHTGDLWSIFAAVSPGLLPSSQDFRARFQIPIDRDKNPQRRRALATLIRPFLLRRTKAEVAPELPSRTEITLPVALTDVERARYEALRKVLAERLHDRELPPAQRRVVILSALMRLRQVACHPGLDDVGRDLRDTPSSKLVELRRLVVDLKDNRHRVLVFSQFTRLLDLVEPVLAEAGVSFVRLDGTTSAAARAKAVDRFQAGGADAFLLSLKAGGFGLNLTAADYVIHLDPWWNPAAEAQATDRAHRIGQTRPVTVYRLVAEGTIEDAVVQMQTEKRALFAAVLDDDAAAGSGTFSEQELLSLLSDAHDARDAHRT